jgi:GDP-mannose 6-dehydrogenase
MNIAVFGAGYVGCVSAAGFASLGHRVWLVEVAPAKLELLRAARSPVYEPGLDEELGRHLRSGQVVAVQEAAEAVKASDLALICVGTPSQPDGLPDVTQVQRVVSEIAEVAAQQGSPYTVVARSTIPQPQLRQDILPLLEDACRGRFGRDITFAVNPEFLREGQALGDFAHPPFVVVGTDHSAAGELLAALYRPIDAPFYVVSLGTASLLKYACNAFHGIKVALANEIAGLESVFDADANAVMEIFCQDHKLNLSPAYLRPGYAFGGACLPKDLRALTRVAAVAGVATPLLASVLRSNGVLVQRAVDIVEQLGVREVSLLGLSFKSGTDDLRESPLVELAERLLGKGHRLRIYDPDVYPESLHGRNLEYINRHLEHLGLLLTGTLEEAMTGTELVIVGKTVPAERLSALSPPEAWVLDLTRQLPGAAFRRLIRLNGTVPGPMERASRSDFSSRLSGDGADQPGGEPVPGSLGRGSPGGLGT